jgi:hypothetical protein
MYISDDARAHNHTSPIRKQSEEWERFAISICRRQSLRSALVVVLSTAAWTLRELAQELGFLQTSRTVHV